MADTYSKIYLHIIFAVKGRQNLISTKWEAELFSFITGIIKNKGQKLIRINGVADHVHLLVGIKPDIALSDLVRDIKSNSSRFINEKSWINGRFEWQQGFGAFSLSHSHLSSAINYIEHQKEHHKKNSFREEYEKFLKLYEVEYKPQYLFDEQNNLEL
ncbi:IS200/IS605 family transposase [Salinimicrobium oceani]|uniref:IS200/IS605 family transposase n=1 Tax=Salinimicrobium oceani TaxID=2722702 RepID=A0ABX1CYP5_9FLAO|nr:IS200/IS605 family transposase [Salinimicrobium oceani]NJW52059.1 IS200/IS605 family transposase [Salinimicrobium oceani]